MPKIQISQETFERLQSHAQPLVDTTETVINRALDALDHQNIVPPPTPKRRQGELQINLLHPPDLKHTKMLDAEVDGAAVQNLGWNILVQMMVRTAVKRSIAFDDIDRMCPSTIVNGRKRDTGYGYLPDIDVSVRYMNANRACQAFLKIAQNLGIALDIGFMWRNKKDAVHPGQRGRIRTTGSTPAYPSSPPAQSTPLNTERQIDPLQLPDLLHTKILEVEVAGAAVQNPSWNTLLKMMIRSAIKRGRAFDEIARMCPHTIINGRKQDKGYRYLPDIDVSVRYHAVNKACPAVVKIAQYLGIALDIGLLWRNKEDAAYPGERGRLRIPGSASA